MFRSSRSLPRLLAALVLLLTPAAATARGLLQLSLAGEVAVEGGGRVELLVGSWVPAREEARELEVSLHLAQGTTAPEILELVQARLEAAGFPARLTRAAVGKADAPPRAHLLLDECLFVQLRLAPGMTSTITSCEGPIGTLTFGPSQAHTSSGRLVVSASAIHDHDERRSYKRFVLDLPEGAHPSKLSESMFQEGTDAGWLAERSGPMEWSPIRLKDGSRIVGMSVRIESEADWGLRVELPRRPR